MGELQQLFFRLRRSEGERANKVRGIIFAKLHGVSACAETSRYGGAAPAAGIDYQQHAQKLVRIQIVNFFHIAFFLSG